MNTTIHNKFPFETKDFIVQFRSAIICILIYRTFKTLEEKYSICLKLKIALFVTLFLTVNHFQMNAPKEKVLLKLCIQGVLINCFIFN